MNILSWVSTISILLSVIAFFQMAEYLYRREIIEHRLAGVRIDLVYSYYISHTLQASGHIGIWFWLNIVCFFGGVLLGFLQDFVLPYM